MLWNDIWIVHHSNEEKNIFENKIKTKLGTTIEKIKNQIKKTFKINPDKEYRKILKDKTTKFLDKFIYVIALFWPIMTAPQIIKIRETKDVVWLSIRTRSAYLVNSSFWLIYWLLHKEKPIIIGQIFWILVNGSIFISIILYW